MPTVSKSTHIGIHKSDNNSVLLTTEDNIKKARRTAYSLFGAGFHGRNCVDLETLILFIRTYVLPILTCGLEIVFTPHSPNL